MKSLLHSRIARWGILIVVLVGVMVAAGATLSSSGKKTQASDALIGTVANGPLTITVTESGTIRSRQQEIIKSQVEGTATILYLILEGTRVKKGDLLVELDVTKVEDQKISQLIVVQNADAAAISAEETLAVAESQAKSDIAQATLDRDFAKEDLEKYEKGDYPAAKKQAESDVTLAEANLTQAQYKADWSKKLYDEKFISYTELEADKLSALNTKTRLELAKSSLKLLEDYTYKRKVTELKAAVEQTQMALDRVQRKAAADIVQAKASLLARKSELERQKMVLSKLQNMIDNAKMYAPTDGLVVYATTGGGGGGGFRGNREPLAEGQSVRERQELICLPTANSAMAEIKIHESVLDKVRIGLPVRVTVDAVRDKVFTGRVARIAPLPDAQSFWENPDLKVFNTEIWLEGDTNDLRTGMTCRAEVIVDHYPDALHVPVQAVVRVGGKPTVFVPGENGSSPVARLIEIGLDNNSRIRVTKGLAAGEQIILNPPLAAAGAPDQAGMSGPMPTIPPMTGAAGPQTRPAGMPGMGMPGMPMPGAGMPGAGMRAGQMGDGQRTPGEARGGQDRGGADRAGMGEGRRPGQGPGNLTPEQMEQRRKQFESMTPEDRQKMMEQFRARRPRNAEGGPGGNAQPAGNGGNPQQ